MIDSNFIVFRFRPDFPEHLKPPRFDGWWYDKNQFRRGQSLGVYSSLTAEPTGQFETRDDGAVAEVWEIQ